MVQDHVEACRGLTMPESGVAHSTTPLIGLVGGPVPSRIRHTEPLTLISGRDRRKETSPANAPGPGLTHSACPVWRLPGLTAWAGLSLEENSSIASLAQPW
jgi:hypothetical protein